MKGFLKLTLLALCLGLAMSKTPLTISARSEMSLMNLMIRYNAQVQDNPSRSTACFSYYIPILSDIVDEYERSYTACITTAEASREGIDNTTLPEREAIESAAEGACQLLSTCNSFDGAIPFFECYANAGSTNAPVMYTISANASEIAAVVKEEYRLIQVNQDRCTNASQRAYDENYYDTSMELQSCLMGLSSVPTTPPPQTTTTSEEPSPTPTTVPATDSTTTSEVITTQTTPEPETEPPTTTDTTEGTEGTEADPEVQLINKRSKSFQYLEDAMKKFQNKWHFN